MHTQYYALVFKQSDPDAAPVITPLAGVTNHNDADTATDKMMQDNPDLVIPVALSKNELYKLHGNATEALNV